jgi:hypothetical protein
MRLRRHQTAVLRSKVVLCAIAAANGWETGSFMRFNNLWLMGILLALSGCISGAPTLTSDQEAKVAKITVYKAGDKPDREFKVLQEISAADCSGAPAGGRIWGTAEKSIDTLKRKAVELNADAVINTSCGAVPLVLNSCWAAQKCTGEAVVFQ